jgi:hypothetical protein
MMRRRGNRGLFLLKSRSDMAVSCFKTAMAVPESGIYRVIHAAHRLPHSVTLFMGDIFPRCAKCADLVMFELLHGVPDQPGYERLRLYELPVLEDENQDAAAS